MEASSSGQMELLPLHWWHLKDGQKARKATTRPIAVQQVYRKRFMASAHIHRQLQLPLVANSTVGKARAKE